MPSPGVPQPTNVMGRGWASPSREGFALREGISASHRSEIMDTTRRLKTPGLHPGASRRGAWREVCLELPGGLILGERLPDSLRARAPILQASESSHRRARSIGRLFCPPMHEHHHGGSSGRARGPRSPAGLAGHPSDEKGERTENGATLPRWSTLHALLDLEQAMCHEPVSLSMDAVRGLLVEGFDEAEHIARRLVDPVRDCPGRRSAQPDAARAPRRRSVYAWAARRSRPAARPSGRPPGASVRRSASTDGAQTTLALSRTGPRSVPHLCRHASRGRHSRGAGEASLMRGRAAAAALLAVARLSR